jgi:hypothetical protein
VRLGIRTSDLVEIGDLRLVIWSVQFVTKSVTGPPGAKEI